MNPKNSRKKLGMTIIQFKKLLDNATLPEDKARLLAAREPQSGAWLNAAPITAIGLRLSDEAIRISIGLRLGQICVNYFSALMLNL